MIRIPTAWVSVVVVVAVLVVAGCTTTNTSSSKTMTSGTSDTDKKHRRSDALDNYIKLGLGYLSEGNRDGARFNFQKALEINSRSPGAHNGLALLYQLDKEYPLAEEHFRKALQYDSKYTRGRNNFGVFLYKRKRYDEAFEQLTIASEDVNYSRRARVFLSLGMAASRLGKEAEAKQAWEKALALDPRMSTPYFELADIYFREQDLPRAKIYLDRFEAMVGPTARALWLGVRLERAFANKNGEASKALALKKMFPYSKEYLAYKEWLAGQ